MQISSSVYAFKEFFTILRRRIPYVDWIISEKKPEITKGFQAKKFFTFWE